MSTAIATRTSPAHSPAFVTYEQVDYSTGTARLHFTCPSSRPGQAPHDFYCDEDGGRPSCSCPGYEHQGRCTLSQHAETILRNYWLALYAGETAGALAERDRRLAATERAGLLDGAARLRWSVLGDVIGARTGELVAAAA